MNVEMSRTINQPPQDALEKTRLQDEAIRKGSNSDLAWLAPRRTLDRIDPSYRG